MSGLKAPTRMAPSGARRGRARLTHGIPKDKTDVLIRVQVHALWHISLGQNPSKPIKIPYADAPVSSASCSLSCFNSTSM